MNKAEIFIKDCTRNCSNEIGYCHNKTRNHNHVFYNWLTPDQARKAVEIARKEMIEKACKWLKDYKSPLEELGLHTFIDDGFINDLRKAMRDE